MVKLIVNVTPRFLLEKVLFRKLLHWFQEMNGLSNAIFGKHGFFEMTLKEMERHRDNLDENNPMDFLGNEYFFTPTVSDWSFESKRLY